MEYEKYPNKVVIKGFIGKIATFTIQTFLPRAV